MDDTGAKRVYVSGDVQGVFFRATTREKARQVGVTGWVRNLDDGRVEAHFEGTDEQLDEMIEFCHEGSSAATVEDVEVDHVDPEGHDRFQIRR